MKVYVTVIPEEEDLTVALDHTTESVQAEKLGAVLTFTGVMMKDRVPVRLVITNMPRDRAPEFVRASEM